MKPLLLKHLSGEPIGRFPVWMMRQAGRYLPSYREIRKQHTFWEMVTKPEVAAQVSLLPLDTLCVDGVIFFSDIQTLPYSLGIPVEMRESVGPVLAEPLRQIRQFEIFDEYEAAHHTHFVGTAQKLIREKISDDMALLGFAGAPWTVGCYLIEGRATRNFQSVLTWMHRDAAALEGALQKLANATADYLLYQSQSGAHIVQLFDTWLSEMPRSFFVERYVPMLNQIFAKLRRARVPSIYFAKHAHHLVEDFKLLEMDILSVDSLISMPDMEKRTGGKFSLQGNLDPLILFCDEGTVRRETRLMVAEARRLRKPPILNLGHGIMPGVPVENAVAFIDEARTFWI